MGEIEDVIVRADQEAFTKAPPKTLKGQINFLLKKLKTTSAVAARTRRQPELRRALRQGRPQDPAQAGRRPHRHRRTRPLAAGGTRPPPQGSRHQHRHHRRDSRPLRIHRTRRHHRRRPRPPPHRPTPRHLQDATPGLKHLSWCGSQPHQRVNGDPHPEQRCNSHRRDPPSDGQLPDPVALSAAGRTGTRHTSPDTAPVDSIHPAWC